MLDYNEIGDGEAWELFARDFFAALGFVIEIPPGRGPDQGRDLLISEQLSGRLGTEKFAWLVSCKYFTESAKAVGTGDEPSILDRVAHHRADGFIGFYSTIASASLVDRLKEFRRDGRLKAYEIFDHKSIEGRFYSTGLSNLALRYFPKSYGHMRPIQKLLGEYVPLRCEICGTDVLQASLKRPYSANIVWSYPRDDYNQYTRAYVACKGDCDHKLQARLKAQGEYTGWEDVSDLANPVLFLKNALTYMNQLHSRRVTFSHQAHEDMKHIYMALAQRTLREVTEEDAKRFAESLVWEGL